MLAAYRGTATEADVTAYAAALKKIIDDPAVDDAFKALMLVLPSESEIAAALGAEVDTDKVHAARDGLRTAIAKQLASELDAIWQRTGEPGPYRPDPASTARRALRQTALSLMVMGERKRGIGHALA